METLMDSALNGTSIRRPQDYEIVSWADFLRRFRWRQGEHLMATAPTESGKTTLLREILDRDRPYQIIFATKKTDPSLNKFLKAGYVRRETFDDIKPWDNKIMLWPHHRKLIKETRKYQAHIFEDALNKIFNQGNWTLIADEYHYMCEFLKLGDLFTMYQHQGRSAGLTVVSGFQRPAWVPVVTYSGATHAFVWKTTDAGDAKRLSDLGGVNAKQLAEQSRGLAKHQFIYVNTRGSDQPIISEVELGKGNK